MRLSLFAVAALLSVSLTAHADTLQTFQTTGSFVNGGTLSGTLMIDTTTGMVTGINEFVGAPISLDFTAVTTQKRLGTNQYVLKSVLGNNELDLVFNTTSLVGFTGGNLSDSTQANGFSSDLTINGAYYSDLAAGQLSAATPEPSSFVLLGTGILGVAGALRRRFA